jgi:hypothetical protein
MTGNRPAKAPAVKLSVKQALGFKSEQVQVAAGAIDCPGEAYPVVPG